LKKPQRGLPARDENPNSWKHQHQLLAALSSSSKLISIAVLLLLLFCKLLLFPVCQKAPCTCKLAPNCCSCCCCSCCSCKLLLFQQATYKMHASCCCCSCKLLLT
jgi:hypothetical protein